VDLVTIGKMSQVCATFFTGEFNPKPGLLSQTFTSSSSAIHAACVVLDELMRGDYLGAEGKIARLSEYFTGRLSELACRSGDKLKGPFGFGAMIAFTVFDGSPEKTQGFAHELYKNGVMTFIAGRDPVRIRMLIPVGAITTGDIDAVMGIIEKTLQGPG